MQLSRLLWALAVLLGLGGCSGPLFFLKKPARLDAEQVYEKKGAPTGIAERVSARMEMQDIRYDGKNLSGRLLISPLAGSLCLDKGFIEEFALVLDAVSECETGRHLGFFVADVLAPPLKEEDVLVLKPGYWYGKDVSLFHVARLRVRATRASQSPDAGMPAEPSPTPDRGAPTDPSSADVK
jgi:hypothetical protein